MQAVNFRSMFRLRDDTEGKAFTYRRFPIYSPALS